MSTSASLSLSKHQISNVKQTINDLKTENTEYMNTMKKLIDSTQDVHRANKKLEQGIQLHRDYLIRLNDKITKAPKLLEKSKLLNQKAINRMRKYQKQISKQTRGVSVQKIRNEIEKMLADIDKIKQNTNHYKQQVENEKAAINDINKLNELKHELVKMNQSLTAVAQKLLDSISRLQMPSEIEKHVEELKQKMLKSNSIRKKLEAEDPTFENSNSEIFANVDDRLKQAIPIFDDLESLFLSSSSEVQTMKLSSDPISVICSELAFSDISKLSQKSSARIDVDSSSLKMTKSDLFQKNNSESSASLNLIDENISTQGKDKTSKSLNISSTITETVDAFCNKNQVHSKEEDQLPNNLNDTQGNHQKNTNDQKEKLEIKNPKKFNNITSNSENKESEPQNESFESHNNVDSKNRRTTSEDQLLEQSIQKNKSKNQDSKSEKSKSDIEFNAKHSNLKTQDKKIKTKKQKSTEDKTKLENTQLESDISDESESQFGDYESQEQTNKSKHKKSKSLNKGLNSKKQDSKPVLKRNHSKSQNDGFDSTNVNSKLGSEIISESESQKEKSKTDKELESENKESDLNNKKDKIKKKHKIKVKVPRSQTKNIQSNHNSESDNEVSDIKNSCNSIYLSNKSTDADLNLSSLSNEKIGTKTNQDETIYSSEKNINADKPIKPKKQKSSKKVSIESTITDNNSENSNDETENSYSEINLSKTQPRIRNLFAKTLPSKTESDSNIRNSLQTQKMIDPNRKKRRKRKSKPINIDKHHSSSLLPDFNNEKDSKESDISKVNQIAESDSYSEIMKEKESKNNRSNDDSTGISKIFNPLAEKLTSMNDDEKPENQNNFVLKKKKNIKLDQTQKKEVDSDSDNYEPSLKVHNDKKTNKHKNNKPKTKKIRKRKDGKPTTDLTKKEGQNEEINSGNNVIKKAFTKVINDSQLKKLDNDSMSTETYNDAYETDGDLTSHKKSESEKRRNPKRVSIYDSEGNQIMNSIFVDENGIPLKTTPAFGEDGNPINKLLQFDEKGNNTSNNLILDEFGNKVKFVIQLNNDGQPMNKRIYDSQGNEIKDASKISLKYEKIKKENEKEKPKTSYDINADIFEEEEEEPESTSNVQPQLKPNDESQTKNQSPSILALFDSEGNQIKNPVLIDSENRIPIYTKLFDSSNKLIQNPIETDSDGKPQIKVFDPDGQEVGCLITVNEDGTPVNPMIYDQNGKQIKSLKCFMNDSNPKIKKKKIKKKKHRIFDKDNNEIKNILLIDTLGNPLNTRVFNQDGEEVKTSITLNKELYDSNNVKIDSIIEVDSLMHPIYSKVYDSKGNQIDDLSNLMPKKIMPIESSASLSNSNDEKLNDDKAKPKLKIDTKKRSKSNHLTASIDENGKPINATLFDSDGNEISVVEFNSDGSPKKQIYDQNKKRITKIIIEDQDEIESVSSLSSEENDDNLRRSKSDLNDIFCDANGNEFKNPVFVDLNDKPYNNIQIYDMQGHIVNTSLKYDESNGLPEIPIFDSQGIPFSHVVQIGYDGNPTKFTLYNLRMEPVTFPTLKVKKIKREKLEIVDDKKNLNTISFENPEKPEEEDSDNEKKPKKASQTKWTRSILSNFITTHLDKTKLNVAVADAKVSLIHLEEEIHNLEEEKILLERKINMQIEKHDKIEKNEKIEFVFDISNFYIEPEPTPNRYDFVRDIETESEMTNENLVELTKEIEMNSDFLANNIIFEQQKMAADAHFPELEKLYFQVMKKNTRLKHTIEKLERHINIVTSDNMAEYASKETRLRVRFEDSKKEKISIMSQAESSLSEGYIQINDLNNKIHDQKMLIEMLKKQIAEQQRKERPDAMKLCQQLDGLRSIEKKNRENLKMLEIEQNSIDTESLKLNELIDEKSMCLLQQSVLDSQKQLNDLKESFARMRKKGVKQPYPLTNKYELMGLDERIKEAKKQIADVKRKDSVAVNKIDKRIKILQSYGLRVPTHKRVSDGECI
ncbi:hypothetical protein M9Y10_038086 [Tritrichomonas musculus]|uniref:Uncharacterized protein n=1 Tax=Tritrichomonas musculus TaxID=1915356 RepID=A0ABR2K7J2_9EUKA